MAQGAAVANPAARASASCSPWSRTSLRAHARSRAPSPLPVCRMRSA